jgi:tetratricopeptide (TPR) repeat protein
MLRVDASQKLTPLIVGGGPIGLFCAVLLAVIYNVEVTVVDDRVNTYKRPGQLDEKVFEKVGNELNITIDPSVAGHIKDLERALYAIASKHPNITIRHATFLSVESNGVRIVDIKTGKEEILAPFNLIFDATGQKRAVLESINEREIKTSIKSKKNVFEFVDIADTPKKRHLLAYVKMDPKETKQIHKAAKKIRTELLNPKSFNNRYMEGILELREKFGWDCFATPDVYAFIANEAKQKSILYSEIPTHFIEPKDPAFSAKKYEDWLKSVIKLLVNKEVKFAKIEEIGKKNKYGSKEQQRWSAFTLQPKEVKPAYFNSGSMMIIPIGDAHMGIDYRLGIGVLEGVKRVKLLLKHCVIRNGVIASIDLSGYQKDLEPVLVGHRERIAQRYLKRNAKIAASNLYMKSAIAKQLMSIQVREEIGQIIKRLSFLPLEELNEIKAHAVKVIERESQKNMMLILKKPLEQSIDCEVNDCFNIFSQSIKQLLTAILIFPYPGTQEEISLVMVLSDRATKSIEAAYALQRRGKLIEAQKYYSMAFEIYSEYLISLHDSDFLITCSNLAVIYSSQKKLDEAHKVIDVALKRFGVEKETKLTIDEQKKKNNILISELIYKKIQLLLRETYFSDNSFRFSALSPRPSQAEIQVDLKSVLIEVDKLLDKLQSCYSESLKLCNPQLWLPLRGQELFQYTVLKEKVVRLVSEESSPSLSFLKKVE